MRIEYIFIRKSNEPVKVAKRIYTLTPPFKPFLKSLFQDVSDSSFKVKLKSKDYAVFYHHTACKGESTDAKSPMHYLVSPEKLQILIECRIDLENKSL